MSVRAVRSGDVSDSQHKGFIPTLATVFMSCCMLCCDGLQGDVFMVAMSAADMCGLSSGPEGKPDQIPLKSIDDSCYLAYKR